MSLFYQKQSIKVYSKLIENPNIKAQDIRILLYLSYCVLDRLIHLPKEKDVDRYDTRVAKKITAIAKDLEIYRAEVNKSLKKLQALGLLVKEKNSIHLNPSVCYYGNLRYYPATSMSYLLEHPELQNIKDIKDVCNINLIDIPLNNGLTATTSEDIFRLNYKGLEKLIDKELTKNCHQLILFLLTNERDKYSTYRLAKELKSTRKTASLSLKTLIAKDIVKKDKGGTLYLNPYCCFRGSIKEWYKAKELWRFFNSAEYKQSIA